MPLSAPIYTVVLHSAVHCTVLYSMYLEGSVYRNEESEFAVVRKLGELLQPLAHHLLRVLFNGVRSNAEKKIKRRVFNLIN